MCVCGGGEGERGDVNCSFSPFLAMFSKGIRLCLGEL